MLAISPRNADGTYGPSDKNSYYYKPNPGHGQNSRNKNKTKWSIKESEEFSVFCIAEAPDEELFCNDNDCYFTVVNNALQILGQGDERVAKFPKPQNASDPWHGYPVDCHEAWDTPGEVLLDVMVRMKVITESTRTRIETKRI